MRRKIRVVLAENESMVLNALAALLESQNDIEVVGRALDSSEALKMVSAQAPDVLICDNYMPRMSGLELAREVHERFPAVRTMMLTTFARIDNFQKALDAGVLGFMLRDRPSAELAACVRRVYGAQRVIDPEIAAASRPQMLDPVIERERQVFLRAAEGMSVTEIAEELSLARATVRSYLSESIGKADAVSQEEARRIARARGWL